MNTHLNATSIEKGKLLLASLKKEKKEKIDIEKTNRLRDFLSKTNIIQKNIPYDSENKKEDEEVKIVPMSNTFCFAKKPIKNRLKYKPKFDYMNIKNNTVAQSFFAQSVFQTAPPASSLPIPCFLDSDDE